MSLRCTAVGQACTCLAEGKDVTVDEFRMLRTLGCFLSPVNLVVVQTLDPISLHLVYFRLCQRRKIHAVHLVAYKKYTEKNETARCGSVMTVC